MSDPESRPFDEYLELNAEQLEQGAAWIDNNTAVPQLERLAVRLAWAAHRRQPKKSPTADRVSHGCQANLLVKLIQELRSLVGCARGGSAYGALHHGRGALEAAAVAYYVYSDKAKTPERLERWDEYPNAKRYQHQVKMTKLLASGAIDQIEHDKRVPGVTTATAAEKKLWKTLFAFDEGKARISPSWIERGCSYTGLCESMGGAGDIYGHLCNGTHLSPLSHQLLGTPRLTATAVRKPPVNMAVSGATVATFNMLNNLPGYPDLIQDCHQEILDCYAAVKRV